MTSPTLNLTQKTKNQTEGVNCRVTTTVVELSLDDHETFDCANYEKVMIGGNFKGFGEYLS